MDEMEACRECRRNVECPCRSEQEIVECVYFKQHMRASIAAARLKHWASSPPQPHSQTPQPDNGRDD